MIYVNVRLQIEAQKTVHGEMEMTTQNNVRNEETQEKVHDITFAILIGIAGLVSGYLSFKGATMVMPGILVSLAFGIVVQGTIMVALWLLPARPTSHQTMLVGIWAVAVTFSIMSATVQVDKNTRQETEAVVAKNSIINLIGLARAEIVKKEAEIRRLTDRMVAEEEGLYGTGTGKGDLYYGFQDKKIAAEAELNVLKATSGKALNNAESALKNLPDNASHEELKEIVDHMAPHIVALGVTVPPMAEKSGPARLAQLVKNVRDGGPNGERTEAITAIFSASLMEVITLLLALARIVMHRIVRNERPIESLSNVVASITELRHLPEYVEKVVTNSKQEMDNAHEAAAQRIGTTKSKPTRRRSNKPSQDETKWRESLVTQAEMNSLNTASVLKAIIVEIERSWVPGNKGLDSKVLKKQPAVKNMAFVTKALVTTKNGIQQGPKWASWVDFMHGEYSNNRNGSSKATTRLRSVNAA